MTKRQIISMVCLAVAVAAFILVTIQGTVQAADNPAEPVQKPASVSTCQEILARALNALHDTCDNLGRNKACYGNNQIQAEAVANASLKFDTVGDHAPIQSIKTLVTSPLNAEKGTWGLSLLKIQANLPDTLPGQNVTFLVYGDTSIQNASGDMQSFYFSSGLGNPDCKEAPHDGIVVRSPNHTEVTFTANGVNITIASTVILSAVPHQSMSVQLVEGHARVTTADGSQTVQPGQVVSVPLGGQNGLQASGAPSAPVQVTTDTAVTPVIKTLDTVSGEDANINFTAEGCVTKVDGDVLTLAGNQITVSDADTTKKVKVGDCIHLEGTLENGNGKLVVKAFKLGKITGKPTSQNNNTGSSNNSGNNNNSSGNSGSGPGGGQDDKGKGGMGGDDHKDEPKDDHKDDTKNTGGMGGMG